MPARFRESAVQPAGAYFSEALGEFLLPYETVRTAADPDAALLAFLQSTYEAAAVTADWDRDALECPQRTPLRAPRPLTRTGSRTPSTSDRAIGLYMSNGQGELSP